MAPLGMVGTLGWFSSPEVGIISLVVFLILSITLLALCVRCQRRPTNAYDVNGTTTDGAGGPNGMASTKTAETTDPGPAGFSSWRDHKHMPPNTLEITKAPTN